MNLHQLELFAAVVDHGGVTRAAEALYLTQSAVSVQIHRLEKAVGMPLWRRSRGSIVLTEAGRLVYETTRVINAQKSRLEQRLRDLSTLTTGHVAVGVSPTGALYGLLSAMSDYRHRRPAIQVDVDVLYARHLIEHLLDGRLDLGLEWGPGRYPPQIQPTELQKYEYFLVMSAHHRLAQNTSVTPEQFALEHFIGLRYGPEEIGIIEAELLRKGLTPLRVTRLPSIDAIKRMVEAGLGVTILTTMSIEQEVAAGTLVARPFPQLALYRPLELLQVADRPLSPAAADFFAFLAESPRFRRR